MGISYTRLTRFKENPARAFDYYGRGNKSAYDEKPSDALVYGNLLHDTIAGLPSELTEGETKLIYVRGKKENGLKKDFKTIPVVKKALIHQRALLYESLGLDWHDYQPHAKLNEVEFNTETFKGRFDFIDWKNKIIIDWKTVKGNVDFEKEWSDELGSYDTWVHATHYNIQAFIYLYSLFELTGAKDWKYYLIAASKSEVPKTRVVDMSSLLFDTELQEQVEKILEEIPEYYRGNKTPELFNDNSDYYWQNKDFEVEVY